MRDESPVSGPQLPARDRWEYRVCQVQVSRITFVNGTWQGTLPLGVNMSEDSLNSCLWVWEYLQKAGADGWELVSVASRFHSADLSSDPAEFVLEFDADEDDADAGMTFYETLYLKRRVAPAT